RQKLVLKEEAFHLILAGIVGIIGGIVNMIFYKADHWIQPGNILEVAENLAIWEGVLLPTGGRPSGGMVLQGGLKFIGKQRATNLIKAVVAGDGRLPTRTDLVKSCSAIVSIATGSSIGREGGIVQLSATLASKMGQLAKWPPYRLRLLV